MQEAEMKGRIHNFNAGPAAHPLPVLEKIQAEFLDFRGSGMSIIEVSHRSKWFDEVMQDATASVRRLLRLDKNFHVLFLQGGASLQFSMIPMNLLPGGHSADYVNTGTWATKAIKECMIQRKPVKVVASSEDKGFSYIPRKISFSPDAAYVHITSNNTIKGTQWASFPDTGGIPLICDMSSDIMSRPFDVAPFGLIYAGAQKNLGPAGATLVVIRDDMLERVPQDLPTMLKYTTHVEYNSMFNTPPCFAVYAIQLVLRWLEETVGGLDRMEQINREKADLLYRTIDRSEFYRGTAEKGSRSMMNVTFRLPAEELERQFVQEAFAHNLSGLKGHRSVGGCRASIYNAISLEAVKALTDFMEEFARKNG
jgi:phosphoserine aminotransferase